MKTMTNPKEMMTPWGVAQTHEELAPGIDFYSTASHGGIRLSPGKTTWFYNEFPWFVTFTGAPEWFEEDCDIAAVFLAFPSYFADAKLFNAWCTAGHASWGERLLDELDDRTARRISKFEQRVEGLYRLGGSCSDGNGVAQQFCRYPDGHAIVRHFKSYWDVAGIKNVYGWFTREEVLTFGA